MENVLKHRHHCFECFENIAEFKFSGYDTNFFFINEFTSYINYRYNGNNYEKLEMAMEYWVAHLQVC